MVGDIFIDIQAKIKKLPAWDTDVETESVKLLPGGSALNQGRHLYSLGTKVRFFGAIGNDAFGEQLISKITGQGFPTDYVKVFKNLPSSVCMVLAGPSDRAFVSCYSTTDAYTTRDLKERESAMDGCTHFHCGGYFNLKGLQNDDFTMLVESCRRKGMTVSLNTQWDASEKWSGEDNHLKRLMPMVDLLFVNISEAENIAAALSPESTNSVAALCEAFPDTTLVVTRGAEGCSVHRSGFDTLHVAIEPARVIDATGAGDAFVAGFLSSWLAHGERRKDSERVLLHEACRKGNAVARVCVGREGACVEPVRLRDLE
eukprot:TRINITY_DN34831_c0_g1_i1.p1 TRINITY_DN34831_c0_g1~~TRINITY_DN34831_c0_g1_i1.p1  ORF type:complete len:315 (+),score=49.32 TRINITY_DN34831_c0_g1_i1:245-1189(+)